MLEEPSAKDFLEGILSGILPGGTTVHFLVFEGKQDLEKQLVRRIKGWLLPNSQFIVMRDQDSGECTVIKQRLQSLCTLAGRPETVVRIACRELEAFFTGDWQAVAQAFDKPNLAANDRKAKFRNPDVLGSPSQELRRAIPHYQKRDGARRITAYLVPDRNRSNSFRVLFQTLCGLSRA
ncbi:DUF4276 family protein [Candidatus Symbiobacter mobilis]|uniref:DUF4276 family protein n=1 Tax=Candidatus Symbiobacter mobilis TaxID=1436290 RepID=UPI001EE68425|nr:DUF4276 family protein [Candidatus Symbiobacter mobilis]